MTVSDAMGRIGGDDPVERLLLAVMNHSRVEPPASPQQIASVLHALADHTSLLQAVYFGNEDPATNVGRWLHAYGDAIEARIKS